MIASGDVPEFLRSMRQDYEAARMLNADAVASVRIERQLVSEQVAAILETLKPHLPGAGNGVEAHVVDNVDVGLTVCVSDGRQLLLLSRHYIAFLRSLVELLTSGLRIEADGQVAVSLGLSDEEKSLFGRCLGERLNFGVPFTFPRLRNDDLGPDVFVAAVEFILTHELTHQIEAHTDELDLSLDGFQDYCRLRGREYICDQKAAALLLHRRRETENPELAFVGSVASLLAISWAEQFTPGFTPGGETQLHHPGSDSRLLRIHLEEPLFWRAARLDGSPAGLSGAVLRRAFRFVATCERDPAIIASPLNALIRRATANSQQDYGLFARCFGVALARGRTFQVARNFGSMWGSSEVMRKEEQEDPTIGDAIGTLAVPLFERVHHQLSEGSFSARAVADEMATARSYRMDRHGHGSSTSWRRIAEGRQKSEHSCGLQRGTTPQTRMNAGSG